eukprot:Colp12_sorted_trinity150504_noHs@15360
MQTFGFEYFPDHNITLGLFKSIKNASELRQLLLTGALELSIIDASMVVSEFQILLSANKALTHLKHGKMKTKNVHSEIVFNLSPANSISESLKKFGVSDSTSHVVVAAIDATPEKISRIKSLVNGEELELSALHTLTDTQKLKKLFKIPNAELELGSLNEAVITRQAIKDVS